MPPGTAPDDPWSALRSAPAPSLLKTSAPSRGAGPFGALLLGGGAAVLAGLALLTGRRRLRLARLPSRF